MGFVLNLLPPQSDHIFSSTGILSYLPVSKRSLCQPILSFTRVLLKRDFFLLNLQSETKLVETVANRAHWQRHSHCLQRKRVQKVRFRDTPPSPTLINVVPLSTRLVENRKTQHCPGVAGEGAICAAELEIDSKG